MPTSPRATVAALPPYALADQDLPGMARVIQLGENELGIDPSPRAIEAAAGAVGALNRYPDIGHLALRQAIAGVHVLNPDRILCGAGSMELLGLLASLYGEPGSEVVTTQFGYKYFQVQCGIAGAAVRVVPEPDMRIDIDAVAAAVTARTRLVFLVDPGNPTGARLDAGALRRLRGLLPDRVMLILDGAYAEFVTVPGYDSGFALVDAGENLVVLRTFSKAYGLAGLRVGWLYGPADVVEVIAAARSPNSVTTTGLAAAEAAVRDRGHLKRVTAEVAALRTGLRERAQSLGLAALPSDGNFLLVGCPDGGPISAAALYEGLKSFGIIVRPMLSYDLPDYLRITIGSASDMETLDTALQALL